MCTSAYFLLERVHVRACACSFVAHDFMIPAFAYLLTYTNLNVIARAHLHTVSRALSFPII